MSEITAITPQIKDKTRCNIEVDGRFFCGMKLSTVLENRLKRGSQVTPEELGRLQLESEKESALDKALTHISASMKPEKDVRDFLKRKGYLEEVTEYVVEKMKGYGFLDDAGYAVRYAESASKRKGARLIAYELKRKGVSDEDVEAALSALPDEAKSAASVLEKYLRGKDLSDPAVRRKAFAHLLSKGFDRDTARAAIGERDED